MGCKSVQGAQVVKGGVVALCGGVGVVALCSFFRQLMAGFINVCVCVVAWAVDSEAANGGCPN